MKHVLLLSPFFFPEKISTGKYNTWLANALLKRGVNVEVIASHPLYPDWKPFFSDQDMAGVKVCRGGAYLRYPASPLIRRMILELWFSFHVLKNIYLMKWKNTLPDIVVPIFPPSLFFLFCLILIPSKIKKVGIAHDLQGIYAASKTGLLGRLIGIGIHFVEGKGFKGCDKIVFLSYEMMNEAIKAYDLDRGCCSVIYPPASMEVSSYSDGKELQQLFPEGYKHIIYSGALGEKQNPEGLAELFHKALDEMGNLMFHFFSRGPSFDTLKKIYEGKTDLIRFHDLVSLDNLQELYFRSDVQIVPQREGTSKGSLPSKLPNLIAAGVKLLVITDKGSEMGQMLSNVEGAVVINSWDKDDFVSGLKATVNDTLLSDERRILNKNLVDEKFSTDALVAKIIGDAGTVS